jgi:hypothetical protein
VLEVAAVPNPIDVKLDGVACPAGPQEVGVHRVGKRADRDGVRACREALGDHLTAEQAAPFGPAWWGLAASATLVDRNDSDQALRDFPVRSSSHVLSLLG